MSSVISVKNLTKIYKNGIKAVDNVSFSVEKGEIFAFLGPNGAGKTTTISILTTTLSKTSGEVQICGYSIDNEQPKIRENIGIIFQKPSIDKDLTGEENIRFHSVLFKITSFYPIFSLMPKEYKNKIFELSEIFELKDALFRPVKEYSGGMIRKLEIIRALMHFPKVLFLDEPTVGLDPEIRKNLWEYLRNINKKHNLTIFITTHYLDEVEDANKICLISKGKIVAFDTPQNLKLMYEKNKYLILTILESEIENVLQYIKSKNINIETLSHNKIKVPFVDFDDIKSICTLNGIVDMEIKKPKLEDVYIDILQEINNQ